MQVALSVQGANVDLKYKKEFADLARAEFEKQLKDVPNDARYELFYGIFLNRLRAYDEGIAHVKRAHELSPTKQTIMFELASAYLTTSVYAEALPILKRAYELEPRFTEAKILYAVGALYAKDTTLAEGLLSGISEEALANDDRLLSAYINLGDMTKVISMWRSRIAQNPKDGQARLSLAAAYLQVGRRSDAIKEIQAAIELNPAIKQQGEFYINEIKAGRNP